MKGEYYKTKDSVNEYIKLAEGVNGGEIIEDLKTFVPKGAKLLEIGSGPGTDWEILSRDFDVTGSDFSPEFIKHLTIKYPTGSFVELDATAIETKQRFDCIYANKVLHHLTDNDLQNSIAQQAAMLNADGIVCHTYWKGSGSETFKGMFVNYHTVDELTKLYAPHYTLLKIELYKEFDVDDSVLVIAAKKP